LKGLFIASCVGNMRTKNDYNRMILLHVTTDNVGDVFLRHCACTNIIFGIYVLYKFFKKVDIHFSVLMTH